MKKLLQHIILFLIPVFILIALIPVNRRYKYLGLENDCFNHGIWIHDRIFNNTKPIDAAFLGSSHTINGINDSLISSATGMEAVNFGYCRLGRNFDYALLKEILSGKKINYLFVEARENEDRYSHPIFPYIAKSSDVLFPNPFFNRDIVSDTWTHFSYKIELFQDEIYRQMPETPVRGEEFGFAAQNDTASATFLDEIKAKRSARNYLASRFEQGFYGKFARGYLEKIARICEENQVEIFFVYLPSYGTNLARPNEYQTYAGYGTVLLPPSYILENKDYWFDENHFNKAGADAFSLWMAGQINSNR